MLYYVLRGVFWEYMDLRWKSVFVNFAGWPFVMGKYPKYKGDSVKIFIKIVVEGLHGDLSLYAGHSLGWVVIAHLKEMKTRKREKKKKETISSDNCLLVVTKNTHTSRDIFVANFSAANLGGQVRRKLEGAKTATKICGGIWRLKRLVAPNYGAAQSQPQIRRK